MFADKPAQKLVDFLRRSGQTIVFAESCTAGLIAATCGRIPGVSEVLAGSSVVYQLATKTAWLGVPPETLSRHGAVTEEVSREMAKGVLQSTPHADVSLSITGHLGPGAPPDLDGVAWCCVAVRGPDAATAVSAKLDVTCSDHRGDQSADDPGVRRLRQQAATRLALEFCLQSLQNS